MQTIIIFKFYDGLIRNAIVYAGNTTSLYRNGHLIFISICEPVYFIPSDVTYFLLNCSLLTPMRHNMELACSALATDRLYAQLPVFYRIEAKVAGFGIFEQPVKSCKSLVIFYGHVVHITSVPHFMVICIHMYNIYDPFSVKY